MFNEQRQEEILKVLREQGRVSVEELSKSLKVSPSTIRRDLEEMEGKGLLRRTHGGAIRERKERIRGNVARFCLSFHACQLNKLRGSLRV
ncbi:hypothetical protein LCGC14_3090020 [marine sediment metagenome]|uniref:HTH deoR-type domain-containing protein n=1 Tax=marine sediment metagenome TaxID=412755 RepID=A0A0F8Z1C4_9ZZZZ